MLLLPPKIATTGCLNYVLRVHPLGVVQETYEKRPNDCILLVKHLVNSESLSQPPLVLLPAEFQKYIQHPVEALPLNLIADRARKEYRSPIMSNCYDFLDVSVSGVNILVG